MKLLSIKKSTRKEKKWMAEFCHCCKTTQCEPSKRQLIHFGAVKDGKPMDDFTRTGDVAQRERYRKRHASGKTAKPNSADSLSYWILWGDSKSMEENIKFYKKKFGLI